MTGEKAADFDAGELAAALDSLGDGFAVFDDKDQLIIHNRRFLEMFPFLEQLGDLHGFTFFALASVPSGEWARMSQPEDYVAERIRRHMSADGEPFEVPLEGGGWAQVRECRTDNGGDLAPNFYPVLSSLRRFWVAVFGAVAAGCGAEPFRLRSTASRRGLMV